MKNINEIYKELINHPDFVYGEIYTKEEYTDVISEYLLDEGKIEEEEEAKKEAEKTFNENREFITKEIGYFMGGVYEYGSPFEAILTKVNKKYPDLD